MAGVLSVSPDLKALRTGIGTGLRTIHSGILSEPIDDGMSELLRQLDKPPTGQDASCQGCKK
jgi:hypothetical protein